MNKTKKKDILSIDPRAIVVSDGFNSRNDFGEIDVLAKQIAENGVLNPISVVVEKNENGEERYRLVDGERRYRATMLNIENGINIDYVPAIVVPKATEEKDLVIQQMIRNEGKVFNEYEIAIAVKKMLEYGMSKDEIAEKVLGGKRTKVDYCLAHLKRDERVQKALADGKITGVLVRQIYNDMGKDNKDKATEKILSLIDNAEKASTDGNNVKVTNKNLKEIGDNGVQARMDSTAIRKGLSLLFAYIKEYHAENVELDIFDIHDRLKKETIDEILKAEIMPMTKLA